MIENNPKIIHQTEHMVHASYMYRDEFYFQLLMKDFRWYVTYKNQIIAHSSFRSDLEEWINKTYPKTI